MVFNLHKTNKAKGFTLIELLVVIAIIGLLSSVVLASLNASRGKAYDAQRFSDLRQVQIAIENYYADHGSYPDSGGNFLSLCSSPWNQTTQNLVVPSIVSQGYIPSIPKGPQLNTSTVTDCYVYFGEAADYKFFDARPQYGNPPGKTPSGVLNDPARSGQAWAVWGGTLGSGD